MKHDSIFIGLLCGTLLASCGGGDDTPAGGNDTKNPIATVTACVTDPVKDSKPGLFIDGRIRSHNNGTQTYQKITASRYDSSNNPIAIDYMVHTPGGESKALLVLIPGGNGNARIEGSNGVDQAATKSGGNFLVRSAHLFAEKGYKVVTVDRPDDYPVYNSLGGYDSYRTSANQAVDLSNIINAENGANLPVIIAGTSRGTISAMAQQSLADAIALSSSVTEGDIAVKADASLNFLQPAQAKLPVHVMWHVNDGCGVTKPALSEALVTAFDPAAANNPISGGFNADDGSVCNADSYHGYYGIETCAVGRETNWMDGLNLPSNRPQALAITTSAPFEGTINISLSASSTPAVKGAKLTYSLPFSKTTQWGKATLEGDTVTYTAPPMLSGTVDQFVYVVHEEGGGTSHQVVSIELNGR